MYTQKKSKSQISIPNKAISFDKQADSGLVDRGRENLKDGAQIRVLGICQC
ncbi:hypothetical protein NHE_0077 [Neorickettsia helminthoeca str. Oregon]|uniref:Uncharacterized protein n=1 Tax=Neorickettsia helminthoeca str. Oregon TaxID=1286528 RepID=X5H309_9RICK|nr:hypothetical protein NHE_0077 [Neorickettsia helminthoeca str. Oregon]